MRPIRKGIDGLQPQGERDRGDAGETHDEKRRPIRGVRKGIIEAAGVALLMKLKKAVKERSSSTTRASPPQTGL
ncbi:hypothetical protein SS37A_37420 (plasmid) [Methylocystis iwaonis]|uniref:Uncharacterized protein n=1 Tax=Methylocystis iwaonis TaxID=2885079 RepID=A0ABM8EE69_9HYPH|nr:hypothetical protein SS37A_37420 [Methylocystis iwaonis]